jgi:hypothetical protein
MGDDDVGPPNHIEDEEERECVRRRYTKYQYKVGREMRIN